ncbi:MAG: glycosyltransferase family 4 protein [Actinomycetota bacterium]
MDRPIVVWLTNIPTPYRHHQFTALNTALDELGVDFRVLFMGPEETHRPWRYRREEATYPHEVLTGPLIYIRGRPIHFNPGVVRRVRSLRGTPSILMVGGVSNPTGWLAALSRSRKWTTCVLGVESNIRSEVLRRGPAAWLKHHLIGSADAFYIPGAASKGYVIRHDSKAGTKPWITLPNIIDEARFPLRTDEASAARRSERRAALAVGPDVRVILVPARLEPFKGVLDVAEALASISPTLPIHVVFVGSGSLEEELRRRIAGRPATLLGTVPDDEMPHWYAAADVMMLASHRDASPLATVEALRSGLPLVLTDAVGNADEVLIEGENGWVVPVSDVPALTRVLETIAATPIETLTAMGERSAEIHAERFDTTIAVARAALEFSRLLRDGTLK